MEEGEVALLCLLICDDGKRRKKRKQKYWVRNVFLKQSEFGTFSTLVNEMRLTDWEYYFKNILNFNLTIIDYFLYKKMSSYFWVRYLRMCPDGFEHLLSLVTPLISKETTSFRKLIFAEQRLLVILRYLAPVGFRQIWKTWRK